MVTRYAIILILIFLSSSLAAQKPHVYGKVQDGESYSVLPYVNISFTGSKLGCSTNLEGKFSVIIDTLPAYMIVSHLGYETQLIWIEMASGGLNILMKPVTKMLQEVEIKSKSVPIPFFKDDQYAVLDYEVDNTLVYLLIYKFRLAKSELICKTVEGDTIARSCILPFKPSGLFMDCLGYLHVLSADSSYQTFLRKDTIIFPHKADINKFQSTMSNCVTSSENLLYFREESIDHQIVNFFYINRENKQKQYLASISDEAKLKMLRNNSFDHYLLVMDTLPNADAEMIEWVWVNKILYKPNASVLKKIGDTLIIFNTTDGSFDLFDLTGKFISRSAMAIGNKVTEKWTKEIMIDQITHLPYTSFTDNGRLILYRIDLITGKLIRILVTGHIFPQKLKIHNNCMFYLYDLPGNGDNKHLFRQNLS